MEIDKSLVRKSLSTAQNWQNRIPADSRQK